VLGNNIYKILINTGHIGTSRDGGFDGIDGGEQVGWGIKYSKVPANFRYFAISAMNTDRIWFIPRCKLRGGGGAH
jgi:hypothetical protein